MSYWQQIDGYPGYHVSEDGRVWSNLANKELAQNPDRKGYLCVKIKRRRLRVHVLVARHWLDGEPSETVNHKDTNKRNNHWENLEWMTKRDNSLHAWANGTHDHLRRVDLDTMRSMRAEGCTQREIGALFGVSQPAVHYLLAKNP